MKGTDTFMVYGDLCSGCIRGTTKRIHVLWKRKGTVWIRSYEYWYQFENVVRTREVPYGKYPLAFYEVNRNALAGFIENSDFMGFDTTYSGNGQMQLSVKEIDHGHAQHIYIHYPNQVLKKLFCCGSFERYKKKAPLLVAFFSLFPKEIVYGESFSDNDIIIYSNPR